MADAPSPSAPPPHYAAATSSSSSSTLEQTGLDTFFDIVPQQDQTSFQVGYLGLKDFRAWVKGDVLIKLDERVGGNGSQNFSECRVALYGIESDQDQSITIFSETQQLWNSSDSRTTRVPNTLPFSFPLTIDLPHCIHLPNSSLDFRLEATLVSRNPSTLPNAVRSTPVHLTRYSHPGRLDDVDEDGTLTPHTWNVDSPLPMIVQLERKLYRRAEPICVFIRVPPPPRKLLSLSLRSVQANLLRIITVKRTMAKHELLLAHSGKLCRLHSTRSIILRLRLHPPFDSSNMPYPHPDHDAAQGGPIYGRGGGGGCESITQETLLHDVKFLVRIHVGIRTDDGVRQDITLEREIVILPGSAGDTDGADGPEKKRPGHDAKRQKGEQIASTSATHASSSYAADRVQNLVIGEDEEEYDGYEDVGRSLSDTEEGDFQRSLAEEDEPPPTLLESQNDLQVEVDVEGVGAGVLRSLAEGEGAFGEASSLLPPPPPITPIQSEPLWHPDHVQASLPSDEDDLPPPPTPPLPRSDAVEGVLDEVATPSSLTHRPQELGQQQRPPPYVPFTTRVSRLSTNPPNSTSSMTSSDSVNEEIVSRRPVLPVDSHDGTALPPSQGHASAHPPPPDESFPPAYTHPPPTSFGVHQHPPSYEA